MRRSADGLRCLEHPLSNYFTWLKLFNSHSKFLKKGLCLAPGNQLIPWTPRKNFWIRAWHFMRRCDNIASIQLFSSTELITFYECNLFIIIIINLFIANIERLMMCRSKLHGHSKSLGSQFISIDCTKH